MIEIVFVLLNLIQSICLLIHVFHNDTTYSTECHDPQYEISSEGSYKYYMQGYCRQELSLMSQSVQNMKLNNSGERQTEGNLLLSRDSEILLYIAFKMILSMLDNKQICL